MQWLTTAEVASRYGIPLRKVQRYCRAGQLRTRRIDRRWLVHSEDAELVFGSTQLSVTQAAIYTRLHPESIRRAIRKGALFAERTPGGHWRINLTAIHSWLDFTRKK